MGTLRAFLLDFTVAPRSRYSPAPTKSYALNYHSKHQSPLQPQRTSPGRLFHGRGGKGGGGVGTRKTCVPKMAQPDFPDGKFRFSPRCSLWSRGGGGCVTFRQVAVSLRGPGQSPVLPSACCVGSLLSVGRCGRCSCWCCFRVHGAPSLAYRGRAGCGGVCRVRVSGAQ